MRYKMISAAVFFSIYMQGAVADPVDSNACSTTNSQSLIQAIGCGSIHGSARLFSYSTHNAYFARGLNQDSTTLGGYITYTTAPFYGFQAAVGVEGQTNLLAGSDSVAELAHDSGGVDEAYLKWRQGLLSITAGNQHLNLPFLGDYSNARVLPYLYRAVDVKYGNDTDFIRVTRVFSYKSYADSTFTRTSRLAQDNTFSGKTDGLIALGLAKKRDLGQRYFTSQLWGEKYADITNIVWAEVHYVAPDILWKPDLGIQGFYGKNTGDSVLGKIGNRTLGMQLVVYPLNTLSWQVGYDKIFPEADAYKNGALVTPYAYKTSSDPYFAKPYFTSTPMTGAGNAFSTQLTWSYSDKWTLGSRYSFLDVKPAKDAKSINQSEYLLFARYNFGNELKGLSISDYFGIQTSPLYEREFIQNRVQLAYDF